MNVLAAKSQPVFDKQWQKRLKIDIMDTGNAMNDDEIMAFSHQINTSELLAYRRAVAISTRNFIKKLSYEDLIRKVAVSDLEQIKQSGGVTGQPESNWLLDFWHKKDIAGLLLMPPTRHVMLHLNACSKWKLAIRTKKKFYRS
ncbi:hypothetical protein SDC9_137824 [bioreactor metagenome]|uniref:Uncharacterized protein n=1 Tax=bioreactor metagenome TaxID=1076179 RepID=A0A645DQE8_9ZZZZ